MVRVSVRATPSSKYGRKYGKYTKRKSKAAQGRKQVLNITKEQIRKAMIAGADMKYLPVLLDDARPSESIAATPVLITGSTPNGLSASEYTFTAIGQGDGPYARQDNSIQIKRIMLRGTIYWAGGAAASYNNVPQNCRVILIRTLDERTVFPTLDEFLDPTHLTFPTPDYSPTYAPVRVRHERKSIQILYDRMFYDPGVEGVGSAGVFTGQRAFNINLPVGGVAGAECNYSSSSTSSFNTTSGAIWMFFLLDDNAVGSEQPRTVYMRALGRTEFKDI